MARLWFRFALLASAAALQVSDLQARPPYKKALADHFGPTLAKKLNDCATCHLPSQSAAESDEARRFAANVSTGIVIVGAIIGVIVVANRWLAKEQLDSVRIITSSVEPSPASG